MLGYIPVSAALAGERRSSIHQSINLIAIKHATFGWRAEKQRLEWRGDNALPKWKEARQIGVHWEGQVELGMGGMATHACMHVYTCACGQVDLDFRRVRSPAIR